MKIAIAASEAVPFSKTGGLADVAGALYKEYAAMGHDVFLFVPFYKKTGIWFKPDIYDTGVELDIPLGKAVRKCKILTFKNDTAAMRAGETDAAPEDKSWSGKSRGGQSRVFFIGNNDFFGRDELYGTSRGDYPDNDQRFAFFCKSVIEICRKLDFDIDIMHCNDWQTGLIPLYLKTLYKNVVPLDKTASVMTIHNLGYQGLFMPKAMETTGLGMSLFTPEGIEFYGKVNFLKAGIIGADIITTVSKTYAKEILSPEYGFGLDGVLRKRADSVIGILNGIDYEEWDPAEDAFLPARYTGADLKGKEICKRELIKKCGLKEDIKAPVICFIGRLSAQKGIDLFAGVIPGLMETGANVVIIGKGDEHYHARLDSMKNRFGKNFFFYAGFDERFAHIAYSGADIFMMPSRYEPCGLGQMIAMRYGAIPVARSTGGIADTVSDCENGFLFYGYSADALADSVKRALNAYANKKAWRRIMKKAMSRDFSWRKSAAAYFKNYEHLLKIRGIGLSFNKELHGTADGKQ